MTDIVDKKIVNNSVDGEQEFDVDSINAIN